MEWIYVVCYCDYYLRYVYVVGRYGIFEEWIFGVMVIIYGWDYFDFIVYIGYFFDFLKVFCLGGCFCWIEGIVFIN